MQLGFDDFSDLKGQQKDKQSAGFETVPENNVKYYVFLQSCLIGTDIGLGLYAHGFQELLPERDKLDSGHVGQMLDYHGS